MMRLTMTKVVRHWAPADWPHSLAALLTAQQDMPEALARVADVAGALAQRLGATPRVVEALGNAYGRWDGKIFAGLPSGEALSSIARLVHLVHVAQTYHQIGGLDAADDVVRRRSGTEFDPALARVWLENSHDLLQPFTSGSVWDEALAAEPEPRRIVGVAHLDEVTRALADFVDLKNPFTPGHSSRLARLVEDAGSAAGLVRSEIDTLRRAAHLHDLGNVSVPDGMWTKRGPLNPSERAQIRLHAYHSERIASVSDALRPSADIAGRHHERLDASGYHRGLPASALPLSSRMLASAEAYQSMIEDRSWRPAWDPAKAAIELSRDVAAGKLDRQATDAVLSAAGQAAGTRRAARSWPAGLTDREVDVLRLLARGLSNKEIARELHVSEATVHTHVINLYGKTGAKTRAGATLFALAHDLIQVVEH